MWLNNRQRTVRLAASLLRHPSILPRYVVHLPIWGRQPLDWGLPWWSYSAIDFLRARVLRDMSVFEFGTGGSTRFFAELCRTIVSIEHDPAWQTAVCDRLKQRALSNFAVELCDLPDAADSSRWEAYLTPMNATYDVIVIDGYDPVEFGGEGSLRKRCFAEAERHVRPGGYIVVDDSWRYTSLRGRNSAKSVKVFEGVGPCRFGVTSTDVYSY